MNEVMHFGETILGGADGPTAVFVAGNLGVEIKAVMAVAGLLLCFFGLKLARVFAALAGFLLGAAAGLAAASAVGAGGTVFWVVVLACGIIAALLSGFLYRLGAFVLAFLAVPVFAASLFCIASEAPFSFSAGRSSMVILGVLAILSLIPAVLAAIFPAPVIVISTSVAGGMLAGPALLSFAMPQGQRVLEYAAGAVLILLGMGVQFIMHSRKIGKKEKIYADEKKEKDSVESEVEKARTILEDDDEDE